MKRKLITSDEALPAPGQHDRPCSDCPWSRDALPGWLGHLSAEQWLAEASSDRQIDCHVWDGAQCAGAAIYRANMAKLPRDPDVLRLPRDPEAVFNHPDEFTQHHAAGPRYILDPDGGEWIH